ncbi:MoaD family protein [Halopenitus malekzadehii]|uniref:MoaD family protein n=1 Tax=Halopenitus malekzadehii TaxID=1267564 RepID=A0A1H6IJZ7_9EURY|nr:ubiquitin-like small modifier protein 1 [Halopenitus malekzadehii]SEH47274.1 MoaD family protein [Halopenitus malekzadehii]
MQVECRFFGPFREEVGERSVEITTDAETYGDLLAELEDRYPGLSGRLIADGSLVGEIAVTRNRKNIRHLEGPDTRLTDGDVVRLTPSVYGGCVNADPDRQFLPVSGARRDIV